ncbi:MAG: DUF2303 family protein [Elusimicrobiales bacterium]
MEKHEETLDPGAEAPTPPAEVASINRLSAALGEAFTLGQRFPSPVSLAGRAVALHKDMRVDQLDDDHFDRPAHLEKTSTLVRTSDVVAYVNRYKTENSLIELSAEPKAGQIVAAVTLDYHEPGPGGQRHGKHVVKLQARTTWQYDLLKSLSNGQLPQDVFALSVRDLAPYVRSMDAADLLELVRSLALTSKGEHKTQEDEFSGSVDFIYNVQVKASAGTTERRVQVPQRIVWEIPVFLGGKPQTIETDFTYSVPASAADKIKMGLRLNREKEMLLELSDGIRNELVTDTGLLAVTVAALA